MRSGLKVHTFGRNAISTNQYSFIDNQCQSNITPGPSHIKNLDGLDHRSRIELEVWSIETFGYSLNTFRNNLAV